MQEYSLVIQCVQHSCSGVGIPGCPTSSPGFKGKLGSDMGQPGILTGDTRVSHTSPKGECGTPWYHQ